MDRTTRRLLLLTLVAMAISSGIASNLVQILVLGATPLRVAITLVLLLVDLPVCAAAERTMERRCRDRSASS